MRQLADSEKLALSKMLEMETNGLAVAQTTLDAISDEKLKVITGSGISSAQARIREIQQFANENNIIAANNQIQGSSQQLNADAYQGGHQ